MDGPPSTPSSVLDTAIHIVKTLWSIPWSGYISWAVRKLSWPLRLLWLPLSYTLSIFNILLAPAAYVVSYLSSWVALAARLVLSLEPLYTFFSVAALIGITAGVIVAVASAIVTSSMGMHDEDAVVDDEGQHLLPSTAQSSGHPDGQVLKEQYLSEQYLLASKKLQGLESWRWADQSPTHYRYRRENLQALTIPEEDDDSE